MAMKPKGVRHRRIQSNRNDELQDPELSFRRGFRHGALRLLQVLDVKLGLIPMEISELVNGWIDNELNAWEHTEYYPGRRRGKIRPEIMPEFHRFPMTALIGRLDDLRASVKS